MSKNRTERLQLRVSSEEKEAIAQKAADANMSISDYIVVKLSISLDTITTKKRAVHRFRAGGKSSHRRRRLALGRF